MMGEATRAGWGFGGAGAASGWPDERAEECCVSLSFNQRG